MWAAIYSQGDSDIEGVWDEDKRKALTEEFESQRKEILSEKRMREHQHMERKIGEIIVPMELPKFDSDSLDRELKPLKKKQSSWYR